MSDYGDYDDMNFDEFGDEPEEDEEHHTDEEDDEEDDEDEEDEEDEDDLIGDEIIDEELEPEEKVRRVVDWGNTFPFLSEYEVCRLLECRTKQIQQGASLCVEPIPNEKPYKTAIRELFNFRCPLMVRRIDIASKKVLYEIDPNSVNPITGKNWFDPTNFRFDLNV